MKKKAKLSQSALYSGLMTIVVIIVIFNIYANVIPEAQSASNSMNDSNLCVDAGCFYNSSTARVFPCAVNSSPEGNATACSINEIPLSGLLSGNGILFVIIMGALVVLLVMNLWKNK